MNEWAADGGKVAALVLTFMVIGLAFIVGWWLRALLAPPGPPTTPTELGRSWAGWVVFIGTLSTFPRFLQHFDAYSFATWLIAIVFFGSLAFVGGWLYGALIMKDRTFTRRSVDGVATGIVTEDVGPSEQITWTDRCRIAVGALRSADDDLYAQALHEIVSDGRRDGVWAKALAKSGGDERRARAMYIALVVKILRVEARIGKRFKGLRYSGNTRPRDSTRESQSLPDMPKDSDSIAQATDAWGSKKANSDDIPNDRLEAPLFGRPDGRQEKELLGWAIALCFVYVVLFAAFGADWKDFSSGFFATPTDSRMAAIFGHVFTANLLTGPVWFGLKYVPSFSSKWPFRALLPSGSAALRILLVISGAQWALSLYFLAARVIDW